MQEYHDVYPSTDLPTIVIVLGDAGVGKTCMIQNFTKGGNSLIGYRPTLGIDYLSKNIELSGGHVVKAQIWDTAGQ
jgi:GTPase SAR1 family protein